MSASSPSSRWSRGYDEQLLTHRRLPRPVHRSPLLGSLLIFFLISLIGIPFTGGFFGKFYVFTAAVHAGHVWLAIIGLINSGIAGLLLPAPACLGVLASVGRRAG